jgi:hypothetical protein
VVEVVLEDEEGWQGGGEVVNCLWLSCTLAGRLEEPLEEVGSAVLIA